MRKNMGNADQIIRFLIAAIIVALYVTEIISGTFGVILLQLAVAFVLTGLIGFCPLYWLLGLSTRKRKYT